MLDIKDYTKEGEDNKEEIIKKVARWFKFHDDDHFRIINAENIDCLVNWRKMKVLSYNKYLNK